MFEKMNPGTQGAVGLGMAVAHFAASGNVVLLPLNDNQGYDLAVDRGNGLERVQVKTTGTKDGRNYIVQLRSIRPNKTKNKIRKFNAKLSDLLFVYTEAGDKYLIPSVELDGRNTVSLGEKVARWKLD